MTTVSYDRNNCQLKLFSLKRIIFFKGHDYFFHIVLPVNLMFIITNDFYFFKY